MLVIMLVKLSRTKYEEEQPKAHLKPTTKLDNHADVKGYDFDSKFNFEEFLDSFKTTGFQASELGKAINVTNLMIKDDATIFLSFTGNAVSSGLREIIKYLVKHKKVSAIVTTAAGVEEDIIKSLASFKLGDFDVPGRMLLEAGIGRIGNIFVLNDRYLEFERFMNPFFEELYVEQQKRGTPFTPVDITRMLGERLKEDSFLYWAAKNEIPVYCPGIMDGSFGDLVFFFKQKKSGFIIDVAGEYQRLVKFVMNQEKTGAVILGGGIAKHYLLNSNIFRDGLNYAVYLTTAEEFDGSDSGGSPEEAKSWAKINENAVSIKVKADFTITFPLLVAATFAKTEQF